MTMSDREKLELRLTQLETRIHELEQETRVRELQAEVDRLTDRVRYLENKPSGY